MFLHKTARLARGVAANGTIRQESVFVGDLGLGDEPNPTGRRPIPSGRKRGTCRGSCCRPARTSPETTASRSGLEALYLSVFAEPGLPLCQTVAQDAQLGI